MTPTPQTTDPTRYRFPQLFSPSHTDHISNLEKALEQAQSKDTYFLQDNQRLKSELQRACDKLEEAQRQLGAFHAAMERERKPDWEKWLKDLAGNVEHIAVYASIGNRETLKSAARQLRSMATDFTLKANFVPAELKLEEAQKQVAQLKGALLGWRKYFQSDIPKNADQQDQQGEEFSREWYEMEQALASIKQ